MKSLSIIGRLLSFYFTKHGKILYFVRYSIYLVLLAHVMIGKKLQNTLLLLVIWVEKTTHIMALCVLIHNFVKSDAPGCCFLSFLCASKYKKVL